jgi:hypothetical protein
MSKTSTLREYARIGAAARLTELRAEIAAIAKAFPHLAGARARRPGRPKAQRAAALAKPMDPAPKRQRRKMSAAGRKAISDAQKKRWAAPKARKK